MIRYSCPNCTKSIKSPDSSSGKKVRCPRCLQKLIVPYSPPVGRTMLGELRPQELPPPPLAPTPAAHSVVARQEPEAPPLPPPPASVQIPAVPAMHAVIVWQGSVPPPRIETPAPAVLDSQERGWSFRDRVSTAYFGPLQILDLMIQQAQGLSAIVDAHDPAQFERACTTGLSAMSALALDTSLSPPLRNALRDILIHRRDLLNIIDPAGRALNRASGDVRGLHLPQGMAGFFHGAANGADSTTSAGRGALGGAIIGSLLLPGIGTAIGGALGGWFGQQHASKKDQDVLERFDSAARLMWEAVRDIFRSTWNQLIHLLQEAGETCPPDAAFYETASNRWDEFKTCVLQDVRIENILPIRHQIEGYVKSWGPNPDALYLAGRSCIPPYPDDPTFSTRWVSLHLQLFPRHPGAYENAADLALERGDYVQAMAMACRGLQVDPSYKGLLLTRLEVVASFGRYGEAESAMQSALALDPLAPRLALIRGLMRAGRRLDAVAQVRQWVQHDDKPAAVARELAAQPLTAPLVTDYNLHIPEFARIPLGTDGELQGIVERYLCADGVKFFLGELPPDKQRNAREAFLQLQPGELLLFFFDWSVWQNATTGFVITSRRVLWKCVWQEPVITPLCQMVFQSVKAEKTVLHVNKQRIDIEDANLAATFTQVLREMCRALNKAQ